MVDKIVASNDFTKAYAPPSITFWDPINRLNQMPLEDFCPIEVWDSNKYNVSMVLSPTNLRVIEFTLVGADPQLSGSRQYEFNAIPGLEGAGVKCSHLLNSPYR